MIIKNLPVVRAASGSIVKGQAHKVHRLVSGPADLSIERRSVKHLSERLCHHEGASSSQHGENRTGRNNRSRHEAAVIISTISSSGADGASAITDAISRR